MFKIKGWHSAIYTSGNLLAVSCLIVFFFWGIKTDSDLIERFYLCIGLFYSFHLLFSSVMKEEIIALGAGVKKGEEKFILRVVWAILGILFFVLIVHKSR